MPDNVKILEQCSVQYDVKVRQNSFTQSAAHQCLEQIEHSLRSAIISIIMLNVLWKVCGSSSKYETPEE
jgi:hypothetical protein